MLCPTNKFALQLNKYFREKVVPRKNSIYENVREVSKVVNEVLKEVEVQEPRFISSLNEVNGRFEGLTIVSDTEFEVRIEIRNFQQLFLKISFKRLFCISIKWVYSISLMMDRFLVVLFSNYPMVENVRCLSRSNLSQPVVIYLHVKFVLDFKVSCLKLVKNHHVEIMFIFELNQPKFD